MNGSDPEIIIQLDDSKLNLDTYQQIIHKLYSVIRYRVYHEIQKKKRANKLAARHSSQSVNDSLHSTNSLVLGDDDLTTLINNLDIEQINREVFSLYDIQYGLDTTLALRKVQVLEVEDEVFQNYLECLKEAHDRFLSYIFQGHVYGKMQQNPMHSTDLQFGVPFEFNAILDELVDGPHGMMADPQAEEEYKIA